MSVPEILKSLIGQGRKHVAEGGKFRCFGLGERVLVRVGDLSQEFNVGDWSQLQDLADCERELRKRRRTGTMTSMQCWLGAALGDRRPIRTALKTEPIQRRWR